MRTIRLRAALPALAGAALLTGTLLNTPAQAAGGVKIYHVWFDSPGSDNRSNTSLNGEWVQIKNTGGSAVSLKGWVLKDASNHRYVFPNIKIGAGKYLKIHTGSGKATTSDRYQGRRAYVWNNDKDTATLTKASGAKVWSCSWTTRDPSDKYC
ncbi:lamin tail domain-containing protein [Streptomyces griseofuscus]|uniref:lamin tail domain-containing protein n=1 Tax=Streptomyces TaxID=1883 RepID=UPI00081DD231|nr:MULTISPECIES: lamin tail domain-containing protein [Streptomyces]MCE3032423.1 lamin tail domain-containing protein [Streptomyces sp. CMSTAAHL-2]MYQ92856.1 lamin tail domain-containing protein [Streptomyces sp. SID4946]MYR85341.1 lamin tail domain-containing protein [Streptomyces sp. SID685]SCF77368.1 Lamin Tail Domain [Streptomyces sp. DconLS]SCF79097.1 Lamin Tail Domain [Streptomyces sp. LamerLS-31b]